ncbi:unnamed protein product [Heligmosomoides polygyrus]|uniref:Uncharacterized protein n=1 Tax=Heligmosomoides polygyrus TaxID=6339 RepID=A0A183G3H2_HELPZ|nr:unnamed protein product [Heligmosomoides polygyrus]
METVTQKHQPNEYWITLLVDQTDEDCSSRPTQAYYVPRRLLEGGRGPYPASDGKPSSPDGFTSLDTPPKTPKSRPNTEVRTPSSKTVAKSYIEPRPLMADLLPKPDSLKVSELLRLLRLPPLRVSK